MTTRIERRFADLKKEGRAALVTFLTAGDPDAATSLAILKNLARSRRRRDRTRHAVHRSDGGRSRDPGVSLRALKAGQTLKKTLELIREFRKGDNDTPIVLMGYYNPIYIYGVDKFLVDAKAAGVDGLDRRRSSAGGRQGALSARAQGRIEFHPACDADNR